MSLDELEPLDDDFNPYAAPKARARPEQVGGDLSDAENIRRAYLKHEASIKSIGALSILAAIGVVVVGVVNFFNIASLQGPRAAMANDPAVRAVTYVILGGFTLLFSSLFAAVGVGLHMLRPWARWTALVLDILVLGYFLLVALFIAMIGGAVGGLITFAVVGIITGYIIYLLVSPKTGEICTPEYREVIALTPHIKYRTSIVVLILMAIVGLIVITAIAGAVIRSMR